MRKLNLLPKEILISQQNKRLILVCVFIGGVLVVLLIFAVVATDNSILFLENEILKAQDDIAKIKSKLQGKNDDLIILRDFEKRRFFYNERLKNKTNYYTVLANIIDLVPEEINIFYVGIEESNKIKITGFTPSHIHVALLMNEFKTIEGIADVSLGYTRLMDSKSAEIHNYDFEIIIELAKERQQ